ncbi:MAG: Eco57I restriction-modification methylase domain-containing protein [Rhizobacter sp.]|nr:Eco57I restriction-modification methylase domain-containing protein [Chlorobiales bacterium]
MASLAKTYSKEKLRGQIYTPPGIVRKILDDTGFNSPDILGKTIIDPACGDGRFLTEALRRIVAFSPNEHLEKNLRCIYGWDIDTEAVEKCKAALDAIVGDLDVRVDWNITACNAIHHLEPFEAPQNIKQFDFVVGNPPYIRIQHLDSGERQFIQTHYSFCKSGSTDMFIAFFELAYHLLKPGGVGGFITPNTYFYSETAKICRDFFASRGSIKQLTNYGEIQLFDNATTYSAITVFTKQPNAAFNYQRAVSSSDFLHRPFPAEHLKSEKIWRLSTDEPVSHRGKRLGEICRIHVGITTLCDKAYIFPVEAIDDDFVWARTKLQGRVQLEREILRPVIKGSTLKTSSDPIKEYLLFPYQQRDGKHIIISEDDLQKKFPRAYQYLLSVKPELDRRDNGRPNAVAWYAFGRSQSLDTGFGKKIIFSPMNRAPNFVLYENAACTVYSGYFINYSGDWQALVKKLNSDEMKNFVAMSSRDFRGAWKAYSKKVIEDFTVHLG